MTGGLLGLMLVYLAAAVVLVPLAARLGLGSVFGYLLAGVAIGPWGFGLVLEESKEVLQVSEFGVVMMLFLVGLELDPGRLWRLRGPVLGLGGLQVGATIGAVAALSLLQGLPWQQGVALGCAVAMSSTAIALQTLSEKGLLKGATGQLSFAVLLFQDLAVIPILSVLPLLATLAAVHGDGGHGHGGGTLIDGLPGWARALATLGAVGAVVGAGRLGVGPLLRRVAASRVRELFTAASLLLVVSVAALMGAVGLSAALGTFVAGVVLANSEYRHELVADVEPFKGLLLGAFFVSVGATIDFGVLLASPVRLALLVATVMAVKVAVLLGVARVGGLRGAGALQFAAVLSQVGEFAFVLFGFCLQNGILPESVTAPMTAVTAFSMAATPVLLGGVERFLLPRLAVAAVERAADAIDEHNPVIVAGYGRFGQIVGRLLRSTGHGVTVLDVDAEQVEVLRRFGQKVFYGDASRIDLLHAAGAHEAKLLVVAVDEPEKAMEIVNLARQHFPGLAILARARGRTEAYDLLDAGVDGFYRETFDAALRAGEDALRLLGLPAHAAHRASRTFRHHDEAALRDLAPHRHDQAVLVTRSRERLADFERLLTAEARGGANADDDAEDPGWDSERIRRDVLGS